MLHSIWNHHGPYRVTADDSSARRASARPAPAAGPRAPWVAFPVAANPLARTRAVAAATMAQRPPEPAHSLTQALQQTRPDLAALIELRFRPLRHAVLATVALRHALRDLVPALPRPTRGLPGLAPMLLVHALAAATGADTARAVSALAALRQLDPQREIAHAWRLRGEPCAVPSPDSVAAWRAAMELGATPAGLDVLQAVLEVPVAPCMRHAFAALLAAGRTLARESRQATTPASLLRTQAAPAPMADAAACLAGAAPAVPANGLAPRAQAAGKPIRLRSAFALSVPFSSTAMACWSFVSASRPAAGIASAVSDALVRHVARPVAVGAVLAQGFGAPPRLQSPPCV